MRQYRPLATAVLLLAFFVAFHWRVPQAHFGDDEPMNMYFAWSPPLGKMVLANIAFWSKTVRPMAAIYYRPIYSLFGLNPLPFHLARLALLLANTGLFYLLARRIVRSWWIATLAAIPVAYHANLGNLAYDGAFIYDVLCGGFFFAALLYYLRCRKAGRLSARQAAIFLALYVCALDSKEMAVSLPMLVLAYELLFRFRKMQIWPLATSVAITIAFIAGRTLGANALAAQEAYHPVITWAGFAERTPFFLNTIFYTKLFTVGRVFFLWVFVLYLGLRHWGSRRWDPRWLFLLTWVIVTPLPLVFLPGRGGATLYIVAAGYAMLAALAVRNLIRALSRQRFVSRVPRFATMTAGFLICIVALAHEAQHADRHLVQYELTDGARTQAAIDQLRDFHLHPAHGSQVAFLNDPYPGTYTMYFIATLLWNDPTLDISIQKQTAIPEEKLAKADYVFDYVDGRFVLRKPQNHP